MARVARAAALVPLSAGEALASWSDPKRWPAFVEGFARVVDRIGDWPAEGSAVQWESIPDGRGRVVERVEAYAEPGPDGSGLLVTAVEDDSLTGEQTAAFHPAGDETRIEVDLAYDLKQGGPLTALADAIFIRRALRDSLRRTLASFEAEASEPRG